MSTLSKPRFTTIDLLSLSLPSSSLTQPSSTLCDGLRSITESFAFDDELVGILCEIQYLTSALHDATMTFLTVNRFTTSIHCHLLSFQSAGLSTSQNAVLEEICCIGALVYLKTVYDFHLWLQIWGLPAGAAMDEAMVQKLKSYLGTIEKDTAEARALFLWVLFLGGVAVSGTRDRGWFVARLAKAIMEFQICGWEDAKSTLTGVLWVDRIHETPCGDLWDEAMVTVDVLFGSVC